MVADAAVDRAPTKVTTWVRRLAGCFHGFYHDCPILADDVDPALTQARLWLVEARPHRVGHRPGAARCGRAGVDVTAASRRSRGQGGRGRSGTVAPGADPAAPVAPDLLPMTARVDGRGRPCRSAGATWSSWPSSSARPCSSTTRPTSGPGVARRSRRGATAWPTPPRPSCAWPWPAWPTRRACASTSPPAASSTWPCPPGSRPTGWCSTGTTSPTRSWPRRWPWAWAGSSSTPSTRSTGSSGWCRRSRSPADLRGGPRSRPPPKGPGPDHSGGGSPHPRVRPHRPGRLQVRLRSGVGGSDRAVERLTRLDHAGTVEFVGIHAHLGSQVFALAPFVRAIEVLADFFAPLGLPELVVGGGLGVRLRQRRGGPAHGPVGRLGPPGLPEGGHTGRRPGHRRAGSLHRGRRRHHPLPGGHGQGRARLTGPTSRSTAG